MLAGMRSCFLLSLLLAFSVAANLSAQVNGVPPSVTSIGFGGSSAPRGVPPSVTSIGFGGSNVPRGVPPSVTSLVPDSYANSSSALGSYNFFLPSTSTPTSPSEHHHRRKDRDRDKNHVDSSVGVIEPVYIPFAVPYPQEADDNSPGDYVHAPDEWSADATGDRAFDHDSAPEAEISPKQEEPVAAQPSTVLVFKDGHHSDVLNYAIVGDTLFDFAEGRTKKILLADLDLPATHKANDDRGVDFQIPASTARQ
jgi:hypothetical protein